MLKGIKIRKDHPDEVEEPPIEKRNKSDQIKVSQLHKQKLKEKGIHFDDISDDQEDDQPKFKTKGQKNKENQKKGEILYQQRQSNKVMTTCHYCLNNGQMKDYEILSNGNHVMLLLPRKNYYQTNWHLYIVPMDHALCIRDLENEAYEEMRNYMKCLVGAFDKVNMEVIFYENAYKFKNLPHAILECVAVPYKLSKEANINMYFKQGMDELDGFWATHKRIIEITKKSGGIRKQIPKGFSYFYVDFSLSYGYAHVIENEENFSENFAREILATVLQVEKNHVISPKERDQEEYPYLYEQFSEIWKPYDWTAILKQAIS